MIEAKVGLELGASAVIGFQQKGFQVTDYLVQPVKAKNFTRLLSSLAVCVCTARK